MINKMLNKIAELGEKVMADIKNSADYDSHI